jgi:hypothetical protein
MKKQGIETRGHWLFKLVAPAVAVLILTLASAAQEGLTIRNEANQKWPSAEAGKVYLSACAAVQREFGINRELRPRITLVLGANKEGVDFDHREIRLAKWDQFLFAQGVVWLAFEELMPKNQMLTVAKRAVTWADSTVDLDAERAAVAGAH